MKKYVVVAYDITDDNRRKKISDILSSYGQRMNKSVFECFLSERDLKDLKEKIQKTIKKREDIVLYYYLCKDCILKTERLGINIPENHIVRIV